MALYIAYEKPQAVYEEEQFIVQHHIVSVVPMSEARQCLVHVEIPTININQGALAVDPTPTRLVCCTIVVLFCLYIFRECYLSSTGH